MTFPTRSPISIFARGPIGLLAAVLMILSPHLAGAAVFSPQTVTLDNGMQVVLVENHRAPVVTHMVWYKVGSADETEGVSGIAHFLEHLMFKGTKDIAPGDFSKIVARNGGNDNAFTAWDYTGYFQNIARDRLEMVMQMEADRMQNLQLSDDVVLPERDVIIEERRSRIDNNPGAILGEQLRAALYMAGRSSAGSMRWKPCRPMTRWRFIANGMRPITPFWSWPGTSPWISLNRWPKNIMVSFRRATLPPATVSRNRPSMPRAR